ncbi:ABC transporter ATP-binding protein [Microvirga guangxiensis]|uniref:Amino acid/amide ABC transporter ATP-binding protein 1, HAAT family (TC 3.A.1.4.-) n=1 Tax=Microvirga guangxiensis TaxID=549386 RepID=A0A1G5F1H6_9HYPH|nr:ABC transporter ATP-binding protein [Microvirga guangxiensis]SCY33073.1 amino acid/amide ABC transporter ATP-binding protein 1, HAAT family (TC 3.A.1.4.-) [Microvirga guangxiensis]
MTALLQCRNISKSYGGVHALQKVDLKVEPGRVHGLIGPNGAGKSTFIDVVSGRTRGSGTVILGDTDVSGFAPNRRRRMGLSRSFQRTSIFPALTVRSQFELAAGWVDNDNTADLIDMFNLRGVLDVRAEEISYGQQRLVDLGLALVGTPRVLLLDEPAAGLSAAESHHLADHLLDIARRWNVAVLLVEHDMDVIFKVCDVLTVLETGKLLIEGPPESVRSDPKVIQAYFGSTA